MAMKILLRPLDVLLFRDGRSYDAGETHAATGPEIPPPSTLQGVLRTTYLIQNNTDFTEYSQGSDEAANHAIGRAGQDSIPFAVKGPFMAQHRDGKMSVLYPWPYDLLMNEEQKALFTIRPTRDYGDTPLSSLPDGLLPLSGSSSGSTCYALSSIGLSAYLAGEPIPPDEVFQQEDAFRWDKRTGVGLNPNRKTAAQSLLYSARFASLRPGCGYAFEVERLALSPSGFVKLGGEGRAAQYETAEWDWPIDTAELKRKVQESGRFTVYLATPALFQEPNSDTCAWRPDDWTEAGLPACAQLVGFACAGYSDYGGWDLVAKWPKPMKRCVMSGSVYHFDCRKSLQDQEVEQLFAARWFRPLPGQYENLGIGITLIGEWDYV